MANTFMRTLHVMTGLTQTILNLKKKGNRVNPDYLKFKKKGEG